MMHRSTTHSLVECFEELASTSTLTAESGVVTILKVIGDMAALLVEQVKSLYLTFKLYNNNI